jgi:undecaprenyl-diphosphatase
MAVPVIAGAATLVLAKFADKQSDQPLELDVLAAGAITSFVIGLAALRVLIRIVANRKLHWFAYYCIAVGAATLVWQLAAWLV